MKSSLQSAQTLILHTTEQLRVAAPNHATKTLQLALVTIHEVCSLDAGLFQEPVGSLRFGSLHVLGYKPLWLHCPDQDDENTKLRSQTRMNQHLSETSGEMR